MITEDASVIIKLRSFTSSELEKEVPSCWEVPGPTSILDSEQNKLYLFDRVFPPSSTSQSLYEEALEAVIWRAVEGFTSCICTLGQSGAGKSYLMQGSGNLDLSVIRLTISTIFAYIAGSPGSEYLIRCSIFEMSHNFVVDLLRNSENIGKCSGFDGKFQVIEEVLTSVQQASHLISLALEGRGPGHVMCELFRVRIVIEQRNRNTKDGLRTGIIHLVDISNKDKGVNVDGALRKTFEKFFYERRADGISDVISKFSEKSRGDVKRRLKIVEYFEMIFEGSCKIVFICCLAPGINFYDQSVESLLLAKKAKKIKLRVIKNTSDPSQFKMLALESEKQKLLKKSQDYENTVAEFLQKLQSNLDSLQPEDQSFQEIEKMLRKKVKITRKVEKINRLFLVTDSVTPGVHLKPIDGISLERRMLRYSLSRTSSELKDDGFLMNIIRANKNKQAMNKLNEKIDLVTELSFNSEIKTLDLGKVKQELETLNQEYDYRDSLLIEKIDNVHQLFESFDLKESLHFGEAALIRESFAYFNTRENERDEKASNFQKMLILVEEQDKIIDSLQFKLLDKDDKIDLLQDELDLCRKNIINMQKQLRELKKINK